MTAELYKYEEPKNSDYETLSRNELELRLNAFISNLLENNFEKLCNLIYRHDVDESKFNDALQLNNIEERSLAITRLVIEREMEKVKMRQMYREYKENGRSLDNK